MKFFRFVGLAVLLTGALFTVFAENDGNSAPDKWIKVQRPLPNILTEMQPGSDIIRQGKRGEYIEVLSEGVSWHKVMVDGRVGFMEAKSGKVVTKKSNPAILMFMIVVVLMLGCAGFAFFFINRQQQQGQRPAAASDDD